MSMERIDYSRSWNAVYGFDKDPIRKLLIFPLLKTMIEEAHPRFIADLGCGNGSLLRYILDLPFEKAHGIDINDNFINTAKQEVQDDRVSFSVGDICQENAISTWTIDVAVSVFVINEIADIGKLFRRLTRILAPLGRLLAVVTHPFYPLYLDVLDRNGVEQNQKIRGFSDYFKTQRCEYVFTMSKDSAIYYHHNFEHIVRAVSGADLVIREMKELTTDEPAFQAVAHYWDTRFLPKYLFLDIRR